MLVKPRTATIHDLVAPSVRFQRAVNLKYDLGDLHQVTAYLPTPGAAAVIRAVCSTALGADHQRASVLIGPYGTGKSHLAVVLAALLSGDRRFDRAIDVVVQRLRAESAEAAESVVAYRASRRRLLPVVLSGDEGSLPLALGRALERALRRAGLDVRSPSVFRAALDTIAMWAREFPFVHAQLSELAAHHYGLGLAGLVAALETHDQDAYDRFTRLYRQLAAGAVFEPSQAVSPAESYPTVAAALHQHGYDGLFVLYDEFGRVLETRAGEPFGREAKILQDLAEAAVRNGPAQLHLLFIAHKSLGLYSRGLPEEVEREWLKIGGRFRSLELATEPRVSYRLMAQALERSNPAGWAEFVARHAAAFDRLLLRAVDTGLFEFMDDAELRATVVEGAYPLHPLAAYCLPRLSQKVAQNERTLFTFLATDDEHTLGQFLQSEPLDVPAPPLVLLDRLYDYFAGALRADTAPGGAHRVWLAVENALARVGAQDQLAVRLVKALGVIHAVGASEQLRATTELLAFAVAPNDDLAQVATALERLRSRKVLIFRKSVGQWEFFDASDVDFGRLIGEINRDRPASTISLRLLLDRLLPAHHYPARRYNDQRGMIRFFRSLYRAPDELAEVRDWGAVLRELGYADGAIVYVLATSPEELAKAEAAAHRTHHPRILVALPSTPLTARHLLEELYALHDLKSNPAFRRDDPRVEQELAFLISDGVEQLGHALAPLLDPRWGQRWFHVGRELDEPIRSAGALCRLISDICTTEFHSTPRIYNEAFNRRDPSPQQVRAAEKVIEALLDANLGPTLGISGHGPEVAIAQSTLRATGLLMEGPEGWRIGRPDGDHDPERFGAIGTVWEAVDGYLTSATERELPLASLVERLQLPPFGLRQGVLPVLTAAVFRGYLHVATIRRGGQVVSPLTGATFTELCRRPDLFTLRLERWDERRAAVLAALEAEVADRLLPEERRQQPLRHLGLGLLRWLQALPRYARDTAAVSAGADRLRMIARLAATDPARALLHELPEFLGPDDDAAQTQLRLRSLMDELAAAFGQLERRFERKVALALGDDGNAAGRALASWRRRVEARVGSLDGRLLDDPVGDRLLALSAEAAEMDDSDVLGRLAALLVGVPLRDWTDSSETDALNRLTAVLERIEAELVGNLGPSRDGVAEVVIHLPDEASRAYRFRDGQLSTHAKLLLQNLQHTLQDGGALTVEERRRIALELLRSLLEPRRDPPRTGRG